MGLQQAIGLLDELLNVRVGVEKALTHLGGEALQEYFSLQADRTHLVVFVRR